MSLTTNWGYALPDTDTLPELLSVEEFNTLTAGKYSGDVRIAGNIAAASSAIRNYCGWHVYPELSCKFSERLLYSNGRIKRVYNDFVIQLPATHVSAVASVMINGEEHEDYALESNGIVHVFDVSLSEVTRKTLVEIRYTAGLQDGMMSGIRELVAHRVTHALASSAGVQSETAGGVSITYSSNWINASGATALASDNKEVIDPYRLEGVF